MACFIVPAAEAIVTTVTANILKSKERKSVKSENTSNQYHAEKNCKIPFSRKVKWLSKLLWGGSFLLAFEHIWHGEVQPWFPFLTAAKTRESALIMLHEMSTVGVGMAFSVTAAWIGMLIISHIIENRTDQKEEPEGETL